VLAWGNNNSGQLGNGSTQTFQMPNQVIGLQNITGVAAGNTNSFAVRR
jgi:Regulator of chromosome condensation (RCC1) repeat.